MAVGLKLEVDVDDTRIATATDGYRRVQVHLYRADFTGFQGLKHCSVVHHQRNVVNPNLVVLGNALACVRNQFRTSLQHIHQRHLPVRRHGFYVDDVAVATVFNELLLCICRRPARKEHCKERHYQYSFHPHQKMDAKIVNF